MKLTKNILFDNFKKKLDTKTTEKNFKYLISNKNQILASLSSDYKYSFNYNFIKKFKKKFSKLRIIGMGGSILGFKAIYSFLSFKIFNEVVFVDNLISRIKKPKKKEKILNLVISKSGNTLETISNANIIIKENQKNIFITQNKKNYLRILAKKLKADIIDHNNFIGGRYSVLSEVGMLPACLLGLKDKNFKQLNNLVKNKNFINSLILNVNNIIYYLKNKKYNSIIINFDSNSDDLFKWYQQLVAESLGKKGKGIYPIISTMPKDNHSLMQLYLDGPQKNFFTFFNVNEKSSNKLLNNLILPSHDYLKNKNLNEILKAQKFASEKIFLNKKIPFRSFDILNRSEETLGELFSFFILETILIAKVLKINPYDQPAVELIKNETLKKLISYK